MGCSATAAACGGFSRRNRMPPCTLGCSVLTRPSSISGKPVRSEISLTAMPESRNSFAVPPVEMSSIPWPESWRAKSTKPVLSVTLRMARWIREVLEDMIGLLGNNGSATENSISYQSLVVCRWNPPGPRESCERPTNIDQRWLLRFCLGLQFDVTVGEFDGEFHVLAVVLLADLFRLFRSEERRVGKEGRSRW